MPDYEIYNYSGLNLTEIKVSIIFEQQNLKNIIANLMQTLGLKSIIYPSLKIIIITHA